MKRLALEEASGPGCDADAEAADVQDFSGELLCLRPVRHGLNTCQGDSGGGVYTRIGGTLVLSGMTLGGSGCGAEDSGLYIGAGLIGKFAEAQRGPTDTVR